MSASVLRNVIQPKTTPPSIPRAGVEDFGDVDRPPEDMELVLGVLVENAPVAMAMFDSHLRYILANRAWVEEFSLQNVQPLIGRSQYEVFPGMHPGWKQVYDRALQGHVVRSEHDAMAGPDGRRLIYRWEVRPWRRKRDAAVGGLMVTCEKFVDGVVPESSETEALPEVETPVAASTPELAGCALPMLLLDADGVVQQANAAAVELCLARGIQEGSSVLWEIFAHEREAAALQQQWKITVEKLGLADAPSGVTLQLPAPQPWAMPATETTRPQRWLVSPAKSGDRQHFLALALPGAFVSEAAPRPPIAAPAAPLATTPNLPAIANAVAAITQPNPDTAQQTQEVRRLTDELSRAKQELRTLHEAERVFTERESRIRQYLDVLPCGVMVLDDLGTPLYQNEPLTKLLGRSVLKEETVEQWLAAACPSEEHRLEVATLWREDVWRRQLTRTFSLATADGLLKELEFQPSSLPDGGLLICIQDATEYCRHEEQLRATEAKFRTLLHESPVAVVLMDKAGAVFEVNHLAESLLGHPKNELRRYPLDAWLEPESGSARRETLRQLIQEGERMASLEVLVRQPEGAPPVPVNLTLAQVMDAAGDPHCTVHFFQKVEQPLPASAPAAEWTPEVPAVMAAMPTGLFTTHPVTRTEEVETSLLCTNVNGRVKSWSDRGLALLGLPADEAKGRSLHLHFKPSDATGFYAELTRLAQQPELVHEMTCFSSSGERQACRLRVVALGGGGFDFELIELQQIQITEEVTQPVSQDVMMSSAPMASLGNVTGLPARWPGVDLSREKLLLSETHHRIKNHLQIISSLLNLELNSISDASARGALRSSQHRVRAIAELHQHLYQIALGSDQSFSVFAHGLVDRLRDCYGMGPERVTVQLNLQEGSIQQEWLMPLALTLNETLSNCFEHAFPEGRVGQVQVSLTLGSQGGELIVSDDGIGLPEETITSGASGLGLKILGVFAEQMRGQLRLNRGNSGGTEIQLRFPIAYTDI